MRNVRIASTIICLVSVACGLPRLFEFEIGFIHVSPPFPPLLAPHRATQLLQGVRVFPLNGSRALTAEAEAWRSGAVRSCIRRFPPMIRALGIDTFYNLYFWTRALFFITLPSILLLILNALLVTQAFAGSSGG